MRSIMRTGCAALALAACLGAAFTGAARASDKAPAAVAAEDFFKRAAMKDPALSPSGQRVAAILVGPSGRAVLGVVDLENPAKSRVVAAAPDADVYEFQWVNNERLVFGVVDLAEPVGSRLGFGWYAVGADGSNPRRLIRPRPMVTESTHIKARELEYNHSLLRTLHDGSDDVIVTSYKWDLRGDRAGTSLLRLNTATGMSSLITQGAPAGATHWVVDGRGRPRAMVAAEADRSRLYWHNLEKGTWEVLQDRPLFDAAPTPLAVDAGGTLFVSAVRDDAARTEALFRYDLAARRPEAKPILALAGFDFAGALEMDAADKLVGAHFVTDAAGTAWFDPAWQRVQERVDKLLPATTNRIACGRCDASVERVIVHAASDRQSPTYWLYDLRADRLQAMGAERPWLDPKTMAERQFFRIQARDGLEMPVYLTVPQGKGPFPAVVLVHGGPWVRGPAWEWDAPAQFLASRGYLVIAPEFRGSTGFGERHMRAGFRQWGLAMQDDLADAATWAVKKGLADGRRVCIAGASYGGYAALMGLVRHPELYRCGINWVGVTDIDLMYTSVMSDFTQAWQRYGMPELVGDRVKDAAQLAATSPLQQAARIRQPLLMAYGSDDRRVPLEHGTKFRDAVRAHNPDVEWVVYAGEGHGFLVVKNNVDFWQRVERFLDRNLKPAVTPAAGRGSGG